MTISVRGGEGDFNIILKSLDQLKLPTKIMQKVYDTIEKITDLFNIMHTKWSSSRCFHQQHLKDCKNPNGTEFIMTTALAAPLAYNSNIVYDQILPTINVNLRSRNWTAYVDTGATVNLVTQSLVMYLDLPKTKISRHIQITGVGARKYY